MFLGRRKYVFLILPIALLLSIRSAAADSQQAYTSSHNKKINNSDRINLDAQSEWQSYSGLPDINFEPLTKHEKTEAQAYDKNDSNYASYKLGSDDNIKITIFGEPELSGVYVIDGNGFISMPLIGNINVLNLSVHEVEEKIALNLANGYILDPSVSIELVKTRPFYILGEVKNPGSYSYSSNMTILNAVALAGGFTYRANKEKFEIQRKEADTKAISNSLSADYKIAPGDIIIVKERLF